MQTMFYSVRGKIKQWGVSLLLGFLYIGLGIWMLRTPLSRHIVLSIIIGALILFLGLFWTALSISYNRILSNWSWLFTVGLVDLIIGFLLLFHQTINITIWSMYLGIWLLFGGIMAISSSFQYKSFGGQGWAWALILGLSTILVAVFLLANPIFAGFSVVFMTSFLVIILGIYKMIFAYTKRNLHKRAKEG